MKEVKLSELKIKMKAGDIENGGCFKLISDGKVIAFVMASVSGEMVNRVEAIASQINAAIGVE